MHALTHYTNCIFAFFCACFLNSGMKQISAALLWFSSSCAGLGISFALIIYPPSRDLFVRERTCNFFFSTTAYFISKILLCLPLDLFEKIYFAGLLKYVCKFDGTFMEYYILFFLGSTCFAALGMLLSTFCTDIRQVMLIPPIITPMFILHTWWASEAYFDIFTYVSQFNPFHYMLTALHRVSFLPERQYAVHAYGFDGHIPGDTYLVETHMQKEIGVSEGIETELFTLAFFIIFFWFLTWSLWIVKYGV